MPRRFTIERGNRTGARTGAHAEAHGFVDDAESLALWKSRRDELLDELETLDVNTRGQSAIRVIGPDAPARRPRSLSPGFSGSASWSGIGAEADMRGAQKWRS